MTFYEVSVRRAGDPTLSYDAVVDDWAGLDLMFGLSSGSDKMLEVIRAIDSGALVGKQLDWGAWLAKIRRPDLEKIVSAQRKVGIDPSAYRPCFPGKTDAEIRGDMGWNVRERFAAISNDEQYYFLAVESA